jgi:hypothetical protein
MTQSRVSALLCPCSPRRLVSFTGKRQAMCASTSCEFSSCLVPARGLLYRSKPSI